MFKDGELNSKNWNLSYNYFFHIDVKFVDLANTLALKSKVLILFQKLPQLSLLQIAAPRFTIFCWLKSKDHRIHVENQLDN